MGYILAKVLNILKKEYYVDYVVYLRNYVLPI